MAFQQKRGINTEEFELAKKTKLDNQLKDFMAKAQETKEATEAKPAETEKAPEAREVVESK